MLPQLVVIVVSGAAVFVTFHVEHDCVQIETDEAEHELDVVEELCVAVCVCICDPGVSLIHKGPVQFGSGKHDPAQLGGGDGGPGGGYQSC
jgi:hypothetical protein